MLAFLALPHGFAEAAPLPELTTVAQIHALSAEQANRRLPIRLRVVVTFFYLPQGPAPARTTDMTENMFVADATGGNWVAVDRGTPPLQAGQLIELQGTTQQTDFAPDIANPHWRVIGWAPMPVPIRATYAQMASTRLDSRWIEVEGIVRSAEAHPGYVQLSLGADGGRITIFLPSVSLQAAKRLIDARIRVRGVCGATFNLKQQATGVGVFTPGLQQIQVIEAAPSDSFQIPLRPLNSVLRFTITGISEHRVRVRGVVTLHRPGRYLYIQDHRDDMRVDSDQQTELYPGDEVDVIGFPTADRYGPELREAEFRVVRHGDAPWPLRVRAAELADGAHDNELVQVNAELLYRTGTPGSDVFQLKSGGVMLQADLPDGGATAQMAALQPGTRLRVTGIASTVRLEASGATGLQILMRSPADLVVIKRPPWWTVRHAAWVLGTMAGVILVILAWLSVLRRRVQQQTVIIRQRLESEAAIENRYRNLFEHNLAGVYRIAPDGRLLDCNHACAHILGYDNREALLSCGDFRHCGLQAAVARAAGNGRMNSSETALRRRNGDEVWVLANANVSDGGEIEGTIVEITELKRTVEMLEERTAYLNALVLNNPLPVVATGPDMRITFCNPAFERLYQFKSDELLGLRPQDCIVPDEQMAEHLQLASKVALGNDISFCTTSRKRKDGTRVDVELCSVPLVIGGRLMGTLAIYQDVTGRLAAEAELRAAKEASEAANLAKSRFLANMSHEIRTPLNGILLAAELATGEHLTPTQKEYLETVRTSGESLLRLLNDILDLSKIEAGKMEPRFTPFSVQTCLSECIAVFSGAAQQKQVTLSTKISHNVPDKLLGDGLRLRQVVLNLVGNAMKFTDSGSITVTAERVSERDGELVCRFAVKDTGIGIAREKQALVFREFEQADNTATRRFAGTGLGLAICQKLVQLLGGRIWVESEPGRGSTFYFTMRFMPAASEPDLSDLSSKSGSDLARNGRKSLRVLVAEDNPVNQMLTLHLLRREGHIGVAAKNGIEAVRMFSEHHFDIVLMDIHMPEMDGIEASRAIRAVQRSGPQTPIIAVTASAMREDREACLAAGIDAFVTKPIKTEELLATLARTAEKIGYRPVI